MHFGVKRNTVRPLKRRKPEATIRCISHAPNKTGSQRLYSKAGSVMIKMEVNDEITNDL